MNKSYRSDGKALPNILKVTQLGPLMLEERDIYDIHI